MKTLLDKETSLNRWFSGISAYLILTGFFAYFFLSHGTFEQIITLSHSLLGALLIFIVAPYFVMHFRRTIGFRRPGLIISGLITSIVLIGAIATGGTLLILGHTETYSWLPTLHLLFSTIFTVVVIIHILSHTIWLPKRRRIDNNRHYPSFLYFGHGFSGIGIAIIVFGTGVYYLHYAVYTPNTGKPVSGDYSYSYGDHPFRPSHTETSDGSFIDERFLVTSNQCVSCHADIGKQWYASAHRQAASDKAYITNVTLLAEIKGISSTRYCEGCHAPVALLSGALSDGGYHGGMEGTPGNLEGVNCISCHGIQKLVHTKGVASYQFGLPSSYLFEAADNAILRKATNLMIRLNPDQHKSDMAPEILSNSAYCASCHAQFIDETVNQWGWIQLQDDYSAWLKSPYSGQHEPLFSSQSIKRCQDCHMPLVKADDPSANQDGLVRDHRFIAANSMLPTLAGDDEHLRLTKEFLQSNKISISIDKPYRNDATINRMPINSRIRDQALKPYYFYKGEDVTLNVVVANVGVGHDFPGGTIDINEAWVALEIVDAEGNEVFSSGFLNQDGNLSNESYTYRSFPVDRKGELVWKHDLFNMVGEVSRNVIKAGDSDVASFDLTVPYWAKGPLSVTAIVRYRKLNTQYARWALKEQYQPLPIIDLARDFIEIPLRDEREVVAIQPD